MFDQNHLSKYLCLFLGNEADMFHCMIVPSKAYRSIIKVIQYVNMHKKVMTKHCHFISWSKKLSAEFEVIFTGLAVCLNLWISLCLNSVYWKIEGANLHDLLLQKTIHKQVFYTHNVMQIIITIVKMNNFLQDTIHCILHTYVM